MSGETPLSAPSPIRMGFTMTQMPMHLAAGLMRAIDREAERRGFKSYFRPETGFDVLYFERFADVVVDDEVQE